jgi:hypothetical protein
MTIAAPSIVGSGTIEARGGDGGTSTGSPASGRGVGGGGGGGGGFIVIVTKGTSLGGVTVNVSGGAGGSAVNNGGSALDGSPGADGAARIIDLTAGY